MTPLTFGGGLNVLLAEKDPKASRQHSRNARGKTTVIQAINFCLAGNLIPPMKPLAQEDWAFTVSLDLAGAPLTVTRRVARPGSVRLEWEGAAPGVLRPFLESPGELAIADWKLVCGLALFGLDLPAERVIDGPSVRTLLSYVLRVDNTKDPTKILPQQSGVSAREHISYLLGLDWTLPEALEHVRKSDDALKGLQYVSSQNILSGLPAEEQLLLRIAELGQSRSALEEQVRNFTIVDDPEGLLVRADELTARLRSLRDESLVDKKLMTMYQESLAVEEEGRLDVEEVAMLFADVGLTFTEKAGNTLEAVQSFHRSLAENRGTYVAKELNSLRAIDAKRSASISGLETERARLMRVLESSGALEELIQLQNSLSAVVVELGEANSGLSTLRDAKKRRQELRLQKAEIATRATEDVASRQSEIDEFSGIFSNLVHRLYGKGGVVSVDVDSYGQRFKISVETASSSGVNKMKLLCFDLALMEFASRRGRHPGFLVHDSFVFEGVDSRQVTEALKMISDVTRSSGAQYICTLNSDAIVREERDSEWFADAIRREVLDTEVGGFLGAPF